MIVFNYSVVLEIGRHMEAGLGVKGVTDIGKGQEFVVLYYLLCIARNEVKLMINKPKNHTKYVNIYIYICKCISNHFSTCYKSTNDNR